MRVDTTTPILNVSDLAATFAWFERFGWERSFDWGEPPTFGGVRFGECEIMLCEGAQGGHGRGASATTFGPDGDERGDRGTWLFLRVDDADAFHRRCLSGGLEITFPPTDMPWGYRECHVRHPDGHVFRLAQFLPSEEG